MRLLRLLALIVLAPAASLAAQQRAEAPQPVPAAESRIPTPAEVIMPHITDSKHLEYPCVKGWGEWQCALTLPTWNVRMFGKEVDMGPTKHVVFLAIAGVLCILFLGLVTRSHGRSSRAVGRPVGFAAGMEGFILYLRNEVYLPALGGHGGHKFVPFTLTLFFFVAICNLLGLFPWGSTPTGNISVTAMLAIITFITVEIAGMRALGSGYMGTIVYWPHNDMNPIGKLLLSSILTPIEILSKFTKPFALTVRLFANMIAGHVIILALISLMFMFGWKAAPGILMALGIMVLEIMVAFIQAFIFSLLAAVFIGQIRTAHH